MRWYCEVAHLTSARKTANCYSDPGVPHMKALVSAFALLSFVAGTTLPIQSHAQATTGGGQTMAPDTSTSTAPSTKKKRTSKSHHAKKKSKKSSGQTSSLKQKRSHHPIS